MTPDQLALAQLELSRAQLWITGLAIVFGPAVGVLLTVWFQRRDKKHDTKLRTFLGLMAERKSFNFALQARWLNTIDVVFADNKKVVALWHKYYGLMHQPPGEDRIHTWLELLSAMAVDLGYPRLTQTDLDKFYLPEAEGQQAMNQIKIQKELLRVLENTNRLVVEPRPADQQALAPAAEQPINR